MKRVHSSIDGDPLPIGLLESGSASPHAAMSAFVAERFRPPRVRAAPPPVRAVAAATRLWREPVEASGPT